MDDTKAGLHLSLLLSVRLFFLNIPAFQGLSSLSFKQALILLIWPSSTRKRAFILPVLPCNPHHFKTTLPIHKPTIPKPIIGR